MITPGLGGFTRLPTRSEQYQILAELIDIALAPGERGRLVAACRLPDAFFATLLTGDFSRWSADPVAPLALRSWLTLNRLYAWFLAGFKPTLADLTQGLHRTWWWQQHPISEPTLAAYWFWFEHTFAKEIPAIRAAATPVTWRLAIHPVQQALVLHDGHEAAFLVSIVAEATGQIVAYRLVPWSGLREAPYHVLHDALALAKEKPHDLLVETSPTQVFTRMVTQVGIALRITSPQPAPWGTWSHEFHATAWTVQRMYRHFGQYLDQRQGSDPFQTLVATHDVCADTTKDPAWHNPTLQRCLPAAKTVVGEEGQVQLRGRTYCAYSEDLPLPAPRTPVVVRLASLSRQYGWVWVKDHPYTRVYQTKAPGRGHISGSSANGNKTHWG